MAKQRHKTQLVDFRRDFFHNQRPPVFRYESFLAATLFILSCWCCCVIMIHEMILKNYKVLFKRAINIFIIFKANQRKITFMTRA